MPKFSNDALEGVHAKDYADIVVRRMKGRTVRADWPGSWRKHKGNDALDSIESWDPDRLGSGISIIVHTAYHLSAIRQLVKIARS